MRWVFNIAYLMSLCAALPYLLWRLPRARRYRAGLLERLGRAPRMGAGRRLWVHAASVGEAGIPRGLVRLFRERHPDWQVVFSTATHTGAGRLRELYPDAAVFYWPLDLSTCVQQAIERIRPDAVVLLELELWPNFQLACFERRIPVAIVNGRINPLSVRLLRPVNWLQPELWGAVSCCCARSAEDAERFAAAGLNRDRILCTGSLKYDNLALEADPAGQGKLRRLFALEPGTPVLVGGSTHPGEEEVLCRLHRRLRAERADLRLILVPRHIERAAALARRLADTGVEVLLKTELDAGRKAASGREVILVDTIGDLPTCWSLATCAFVGRSLQAPGGGQNMMEPAALGLPVLVGPFTRNFRPEMAFLTSRGAVVVVRDEAELEHQVRHLLADTQAAARLGRTARQSILESRGATERTFERLEEMLNAAGSL